METSIPGETIIDKHLREKRKQEAEERQLSDFANIFIGDVVVMAKYNELFENFTDDLWGEVSGILYKNRLATKEQFPENKISFLERAQELKDSEEELKKYIEQVFSYFEVGLEPSRRRAINHYKDVERSLDAERLDKQKEICARYADIGDVREKYSRYSDTNYFSFPPDNYNRAEMYRVVVETIRNNVQMSLVYYQQQQEECLQFAQQAQVRRDEWEKKAKEVRIPFFFGREKAQTDQKEFLKERDNEEQRARQLTSNAEGFKENIGKLTEILGDLDVKIKKMKELEDELQRIDPYIVRGGKSVDDYAEQKFQEDLDDRMSKSAR